MEVRKYTDGDVPAMVRIWNKVAEDGDAFPQEEFLDDESGKAFFAAQTYCGVAAEDGVVAGLYILHPNNVGRCAHIANTGYAVDAERWGGHIGEKLVTDSLAQAKRLGFRVMELNAVVENNRHLYERLDFVRLGTIPGGFRKKDGSCQNTCPYYHTL